MTKVVVMKKIENIKENEFVFKRRKKRSVSEVYLTEHNRDTIREYRENAFLETLINEREKCFVTESSIRIESAKRHNERVRNRQKKMKELKSRKSRSRSNSTRSDYSSKDAVSGIMDLLYPKEKRGAPPSPMSKSKSHRNIVHGIHGKQIQRIEDDKVDYKKIRKMIVEKQSKLSIITNEVNRMESTRDNIRIQLKKYSEFNMKKISESVKHKRKYVYRIEEKEQFFSAFDSSTSKNLETEVLLGNKYGKKKKKKRRFFNFSLNDILSYICVCNSNPN